MSKYLDGQFTAKVILVACCLALVDKRSDALFLGNFIGCNTFGCRLSILEQDVSQLKQQVMRLGGGNGMNFQQPNTIPHNPNQQMFNQQGGGPYQQLPNQFNQNNGQPNQMNQQQNQQPNQMNQQANQQQPGLVRQSYGNMLDQYPPELKRIQTTQYPYPLNGQLVNA